MEKFIKNLARDAGKILRDGFRTELKISYKVASWDIVTQYDTKSEKYIIGRILSKYPRHGIMGEESGHIIKKNSFWVIDPLDGTRAFSRGMPQFSVSIAFVHNNQIKLGAVYDPMRDEMFFAEDKKGAFLNDQKITVSQAPDFRFAAAAMIMGTHKSTIKDKKFLYNDFVIKYSLWNSKLESAALMAAYTAAGRYDLAVMLHLSPWDYDAGALLLKESGAKVTDLKGKSFRWDFENLLAANPKMHRQALKVLKHYPS